MREEIAGLTNLKTSYKEENGFATPLWFDLS